MSVLTDNETRIDKDWQAMSITTAEQAQYLKIARYLGGSAGTSTYMVSRHLREACSVVRRDLRKMEKLGYVAADSNGSNNIYWSLKP